MAVLLVTYDLSKPGADYKDLLATIKSYAWAKLSESSYAIKTDKTPEQIYNSLKPFLDQNDHILVITLKRPYFGYASKAVIEWLDTNLPY